MTLRVNIKYHDGDIDEINAPVFRYVTCDIKVPKGLEKFFLPLTKDPTGREAIIIGIKIIEDTNKEITK